MNALVSVEWLRERLGDVVVVDATLPPVGVVPVVDTRARYVERHIPGAVFFDIEELSDHSSGLPHTLPSADAFGAAMERLGIGDGMTIVVYEQAGVFSAPRARWMLRTMGAGSVFLLDGGLKAWMEAGLPTDAGEVIRKSATFAARLDPEAVRDFAEVQAAIAGGGQILDARSAGRFAGTAPEPRAGLSSGHMPGSTSLPMMDLVADGRLRGLDELRGIFSAKGVDLERPVITSCGSGVTAAVVALGLEMVGAKTVGLYDGSWAEYAQRPEAVIVTG